MRAVLTISLLLVLQISFAQHNFLGKKRIDIVGFYTLESDFAVKTRRVSDTKTVLTAKGETSYPYYTYELDALTDECISVGIVSKSNEALTHYEDMLSFWGKLIDNNSATNTKVYRISNNNGTYIYTISQPYKFSEEYVSRRNIFYILISKDTNQLHAAK